MHGTQAQPWRSTTQRLILVYGMFFFVWGALLLGLIYWETMRYMGHLVDQILIDQVHYLQSIDRERLPATLEAMNTIETRHIMTYGLYDSARKMVAGNLQRLPLEVPADGRVRVLPKGVQRGERTHNPSARALAVSLPGGEMLLVARDTAVQEDMGAIILHGIYWGISLTVIPGVLVGFALSRRPLRRIRQIRAATLPIIHGDLKQRLPISGSGDELDALAGIVNTMLGEIERLMSEVKGVCDSIAHDLRTPLTRLRAQLYRMQQQTASTDARQAMIEQSILETDSLLARFRALLRISELEDGHRRAGFSDVDLADTLRQIQELHAPVAEDKGVSLTLEATDRPTARGDQHLLLEAFSNLVANAIKFTPAAGAVVLRASRQPHGARIDILDTGPGIAPAEREAVLQRLYRSDAHRSEPGFGLGLSIVAAIVKLHGFQLEIGDRSSGGGARVTVYCWPRGTAV